MGLLILYVVVMTLLAMSMVVWFLVKFDLVMVLVQIVSMILGTMVA